MSAYRAPVAELRSEEARVLHELNDLIKMQQAFLNSCSDATWISEDERAAIRWLLSALIDHRRRVRVAARMWRTLHPDERASRALAEETVELIDENRRFSPYIAQWRAVVVERARVERNDMWRSMLELAEANLGPKRVGLGNVLIPSGAERSAG
ncbi:MAG: hypothetical protein WBB07_12330 [Mycobacterium sp.]